MAIPGLKRPGLPKVAATVMEVGIRGQDWVPAQRCRNSSTRAWGSSGRGEVFPSDGSSVGRGLAGSCPAIGQGQKSPQLSALFSFPAQGPAQVSAGGNSRVLECSTTLDGEPVFELVHATFLLPTPSGQNSGILQPNPNLVTSMVALGHPDPGVSLHFPC